MKTFKANGGEMEKNGIYTNWKKQLQLVPPER